MPSIVPKGRLVLAAGLLIAGSCTQAQNTELLAKAEAAIRAADEAATRARRAAEDATKARADATKAAAEARAAVEALTPRTKVAAAEATVTATTTADPKADAQSTSKNEAPKKDELQARAFLTASSAGGLAKLTLSGEKDKDKSDPAQGSVWELALSAPLAKSGFTEPATLDGLANGANVGFTYGGYRATKDSENEWLYGAAARVGYNSFKYVDRSALKSVAADRYGKGAGIYGGYASPFAAGAWVVFGKFEYQRSYKDAASGVLCPVSSASPVTCATGPLGQPTELRQQLFSVIWRQTTELVDYEMNLSYDRKSGVKGIDLPIYFLKANTNPKSPLPFNAGIRLGWRSDTRDATLGIFVGSDFDFWKTP